MGRSDIIAIASPLHVTDAAQAIIQKCVIGRRGTGGRAYYIGKYYSHAKSSSIIVPDVLSETFGVE